MPIKYQKPPLIHTDQIQHLKTRGLLIDDPQEAQSILMHLNYYRLSAYWQIFIKDKTTGEFKEGTHFKTILNHYLFDKELRLILLEAIETFEVSFRANWAYVLSTTLNDSHAYLDKNIFDIKRQHEYNLTLKKVEELFAKSHELFIVHYKEKYHEPKLPPIWAVCEIFSFGNLLSLYSCLSYKFKKEISKIYLLDDEVFYSFIKNINAVRNICAHHGRIWNRKFTTCKIKHPYKPLYLKQSLNKNNIESIYNTIAYLCHINKIVNSKNKWMDKFILFIEKSFENKIITKDNLEAMGFPEGWRNFELWKN